MGWNKDGSFTLDEAMAQKLLDIEIFGERAKALEHVMKRLNNMNGLLSMPERHWPG